MDIFYYNTSIYKEILLKFLQSTEKYTSTECFFILDAMLKPCCGVQHAFERCSARLVLACLKMAVLNEKVLACFSTARRLK